MSWVKICLNLPNQKFTIGPKFAVVTLGSEHAKGTFLGSLNRTPSVPK